VFNEFCKSPIWKFSTEKNQLHETQKPLHLFSYLISVSSNKNDIVLDACLGSGTTAVACERLKRRWIGIEIEEKYCQIAVKRIEAERKQLKLW
jgi:site-specific DNA-methyltransferase (adenine-specific)